MNKLFLTIALVCGFVFTSQAQTKGDWYIGTGDIANTAWTEWSIAPTVGYAIADKFMVGCNVSQADSSAEMVLDVPVTFFLSVNICYTQYSDRKTH